MRTITAHAAEARSLSFSPDGRLLASACWDGTVKLWNVATGSELATLQAGVSVLSVAFLPDGRTLVASCADRSLRLWDTEGNAKTLRP